MSKKKAVRIRPCHGCPRKEGCHQFPGVKAMADGLGDTLTNIDVRCHLYEQEMRPLRRIKFRPFRGSVEHNVMVTGTIMKVERGYRFSCVIDPEYVDEVDIYEQGNIYLLRKGISPHAIIEFLDEPDAELCRRGEIILPNDAENSHFTCTYAIKSAPCACAIDMADFLKSGDHPDDDHYLPF